MPTSCIMHIGKHRLSVQISVRAADLVGEPQAVLVAQLNGRRKRCKCRAGSHKLGSLQIALRPKDITQLLVLTVWSRNLKTYMGEVRFSVLDLFKSEAKTHPKWYKLYSSVEKRAFVTGLVLVLFELAGSTAELTNWVSSLVSPQPDPSLLSPNSQGFYEEIHEFASESESDGDSGAGAQSGVEAGQEGDFHVEQTESSGASGARGASETPEPVPNINVELFENLHVADSNELASGLSDALLRVKAKKQIKGIVFFEILSCSDLPPLRSFTRTTFDVDPFVVVTFGRNTFRTSWKRHTLNPVYNERLAFEVKEHELLFDVQFSVLDKDHFSFHDHVADVLVPIHKIIALAGVEETLKPAEPDVQDENKRPFLSPVVNGEPSRHGLYTSLASLSDASVDASHDPSIKIDENGNFVKLRKRKLIKRRFTVSYIDTSMFRTMDIALNVKDKKLAQKHSPSIKVRARFLTYKELRRDFWRIVLEQYPVNEVAGQYDHFELISLFDALGASESDEIVTTFYQKLDRPDNQYLSHDEIIDCLESHILSSNDKIFELERCPICLQTRLEKKQDVDIITHVAICASKDWSIVNKLLVSSFVSPQIATKRWYSKVLIKLTYGKYQLGQNNANILVQDRSTGIIMEEKMSVTVRLGIRLLYKGLDRAKSKRVRSLLRKLSVRQGAKFDSPLLKNDIKSFVKFHKLDMSECLVEDLDDYPTFNDFFYRRLKPGARPVDSTSDDIAVSPADSRCTTFSTVDEATELWIKGRNFTLEKLFGDSRYENMVDPRNCSMGIFRLAPQDYHRFHSPVSGTIGPIKYIEGEYYTVNPMAIRSTLDVYGENVRVIVPIKSNFGTVLLIAVGAMMVGSTIITVKEGQLVERGDEVGYFKFGGLTVLVLFEKRNFVFDSDLVENSAQCVETLVRVGQSIGHAPGAEQHKREKVDFKDQLKEFKLSLIRALTGGNVDSAKALNGYQ